MDERDTKQKLDEIVDDAVARETMKIAFRLAAAIIDKVTPREVEAAQAGALARGVTVTRVATIDRAAVAATLLCLAAEGKGPYAL